MFDLHGYLPFILGGFGLTVAVALSSLIIALVLGFLGALAKLSEYKFLRVIATVYTTLIRGIPDLVVMSIIYFGGQAIINQIGGYFEWDYIDVSPFFSGVMTIGLIFGAYMTETFRGAILALPRGEIEAGHAYGMSSGQVFKYIILPGCIRHAIPGFGNNWLVLVKTTALVSVIGLHDMVYNAAQASGATREPFTFYLLVAFLFLLITAVSEQGLRWLNNRYSAGVRKA